MPDFTNYVQPAHYNRSDGAKVCGHNIPIGPGVCTECHSLTDEHWAAGCTCTTPAVPDQNPAEQLHDAAEALRDPDAAACQHPNCGCPNELHRQDADGVTWCADCQDQHPYRPDPAAAIPERLRGPLADWLDDAAEGDVHGEINPYALAAASAVLGGAL